MGIGVAGGDAGIRIAGPDTLIPDPIQGGWRAGGIKPGTAKAKKSGAGLPRGGGVVVTGGFPGGSGVIAAVVIPPVAVERHRGAGERRGRRCEVDRPGRAAGLGAEGPGCLLGGVPITAALAQGGSGAVRRHRPAAAVAIADLIHDPVVVVPQTQGFATVVQLPGPRPEGTGQSTGGGVGRNEQIPFPRDDGPGRKNKFHPGGDPPSRQIHIHPVLIVQFQPFHSRTGRVVVQFVEGDDGIVAGCRGNGSQQDTCKQGSDHGGDEGLGAGERRCFCPGRFFCSQWFEKGEVICFPGLHNAAKRAFQEEGSLRKSGPGWREFVFFKVGFELPGKLDPEGRIPPVCLASY